MSAWREGDRVRVTLQSGVAIEGPLTMGTAWPYMSVLGIHIKELDTTIRVLEDDRQCRHVARIEPAEECHTKESGERLTDIEDVLEGDTVVTKHGLRGTVTMVDDVTGGGISLEVRADWAIDLSPRGRVLVRDEMFAYALRDDSTPHEPGFYWAHDGRILRVTRELYGMRCKIETDEHGTPVAGGRIYWENRRESWIELRKLGPFTRLELREPDGEA